MSLVGIERDRSVNLDTGLALTLIKDLMQPRIMCALTFGSSSAKALFAMSAARPTASEGDSAQPIDLVLQDERIRIWPVHETRRAERSRL